MDRILSHRLSLVDRYIINQLGLFFLFSVGLFSCLGVTIGTVSDLGYKVTEYNLPIPIAVLIFCYKIPEYAAYALPISILLSSLIIFGRLNSDRELIALLSFGISLKRIIAPALVFSLFITGITFLFNELIVPAANYQANLLQNPFIAKTELNLQKKDIFYPEYESGKNQESSRILKRIYFAEEYRDRTLKKVTIITLERGEISQIITAKLAKKEQGRQVWNLIEGEINQINNLNGNINTEEFHHKKIPLSTTLFEIVQKERSPDDMNIRQAKEYLNLIKDSGRKIDIAKFTVRIQQKYAFPFICLIFASIGSALGTKYSQVNRSQAFGFCVAIVFIYYFLGFTFGSLGITGVLSPFWAAWIPNFLGIGTGIWLLTINY
ncbi:LptF/LptG family permease [Waterburya agarophytonicola K14]|uniref:LptF/LptG family permease n=1 Tax=Waterburya agarophytonicola KI4 TaxID=2874699 RepID=A0A964BLR8_9CYAN|nr:LptF/LptG family permease [Waterburya agarophytonicola KI4]